MMKLKIHTILICFVLNQCCDAELICSVNVGPCRCGTLAPGNYQMRCHIYDESIYSIALEHDKNVTIKCSPYRIWAGYEPLPELQLEKVEEIALEMCPLEENLTICKCDSVPVPDKQYIDGLNIGHNRHRPYSISDAFKDLKNLRHLLLFESNIQLTSDMFENNQKLISLLLIKNNIKQIPNGIFDNLTNLTYLAISDNQITNLNETLFKSLSNLKKLYLNGNKIENLPDNIFVNLTNLTGLYLSRNRITNLDETLFQSLSNLKTLDLRGNKIENLPDNIFVNLTNLTGLYLSRNRITNLDETLFQSLSNLKTLDLRGNKIENLPGNFFINLTSLTVLVLYNNQIKNLDETLFQSLSNLETLHLSENKIENLPEKIFVNLTNLTELYLYNNQIKNLDETLFQSLSNLKRLDLSGNKIENLPDNIFVNLTNLTWLYLSRNRITNLDETLFQSLSKLDLYNNQIGESKSLQDREFTNLTNGIEINRRVYLPSLNLLDLNHNKIEYIRLDKKFLNFDSEKTTIDLRANRIGRVEIDFDEFEVQNNADTYSRRKNNIVVLLEYNPVKCTCEVYDLLRYLNDQKHGRIYDGFWKIVPGDLACKEPERYRDRRVVDIDISQFVCDVSNGCPKHCTCLRRPYDRWLTVNCSQQYLSAPPVTFPKSDKIILYLNNNNLTKFDFEKLARNNSGYGNITDLHIHNNNLSEIDWLPRNLQVLELHSNNFKQINVTLLQSLQFLRRLTLHDNPWQCNCDSVALLSFIRHHFSKIDNIAEVQCGNKSIIQMSSNEFCPPQPDATTIPLLVILVIVFVSLFTAFISIFFALYYRNEQAIKIWLYTHKCCLWFVTEEELDKDKRYDAFVSYAYPDEDFVVNELIPNLEQGENPFKLCIHNRDWLAGVWIPDQIARSVEESRRTLVVLTPNFLNSIWGRMELRAAHVNSLIDRRARVIIIKKEDIGPIDDLEPELKLYLRTNTYIQWGDRNFWEKLRYALPHQPPLSRRAALMSQEIRQAVNNEFELVRLTVGEDDSD